MRRNIVFQFKRGRRNITFQWTSQPYLNNNLKPLSRGAFWHKTDLYNQKSVCRYSEIHSKSLCLMEFSAPKTCLLFWFDFFFLCSMLSVFCGLDQLGPTILALWAAFLVSSLIARKMHREGIKKARENEGREKENYLAWCSMVLGNLLPWVCRFGRGTAVIKTLSEFMAGSINKFKEMRVWESRNKLPTHLFSDYPTLTQSSIAGDSLLYIPDKQRILGAKIYWRNWVQLICEYIHYCNIFFKYSYFLYILVD